MDINNTLIQQVMRSWQNTICEGNAAFENNRYIVADKFYQDCLEHLASIGGFITSNTPPPASWIVDQFVPALVVSYLNLVDSSMAQGKHNTACDFLVEGYNVVCDCAHCLINTSEDENHYLFSKHLSKLQHHSFAIRKHLTQSPSLLTKLEKISEPYSVTSLTYH
jgi:hypothetical protein